MWSPPVFLLVRRLGALCAAIFLVASAPGCAAESDEPAVESADQDLYSADKLPREVNRRVQRCFQRSYAGDSFRSSNTTDSWGGKRVPNLSGAIWSIGIDAYDGLASVFLLASRGESVLRELTADIVGTAHEQQLADYQTAELVMCVTSNLISYDYEALEKNIKTTARPPELTIELYKGVCANFSRVAVRLLDDVGIHGELQSGDLYAPSGENRGLHAWVGVHLDSKKAFYWMEPQDDPTTSSAPTFFNPRPDFHLP